MKPPICVDLFCGAGGLSTGLLDAGMSVKAGFDNNAPSIETFNLNHEPRGATGVVADVTELNGSTVLEEVGGSLELLAAGPPCQPFSIAGRQGGLDDVRGNLVFEFVRLLRETQPEAFLFENVPNLLTMDAGKVFERLKAAIYEAGYTATPSVLYAPDYGVPQMRKRLFIVGAQNLDLEFPPRRTHSPDGSAPNTKPYMTASQALDDLPDVQTLAAEDIPNHEPTFHSPHMLQAFQQLSPGTRDAKSRHDRLHPDRVGYTVRAGSGNFSPLRPVHYAYDRVLSVRECARLQTFEDTFIWPDTMARLQQYRQVGNAVPPLLATAVARHLAQLLNWELKPEIFVIDEAPASERLSLSERIERRQRFMRGGASSSSADSAKLDNRTA